MNRVDVYRHISSFRLNAADRYDQNRFLKKADWVG